MLFYQHQHANGESNMLADINNPTLSIDIKTLTRASDLCGILKANDIQRYAYAIKHKNQIMKVGMSADNAHHYGDRIYRQVANLPGWKTIPRSGCGKDILTVVHDYQQETGMIVHKDDCTVEVWDVTNVPQSSFRIQREAELAENDLLSQYEELYKKLPIGNPKDTRVITGKPAISLSAFNNIFFYELA